MMMMMMMMHRIAVKSIVMTIDAREIKNIYVGRMMENLSNN